jgi:hypothetical protein
MNNVMTSTKQLQENAKYTEAVFYVWLFMVLLSSETPSMSIVLCASQGEIVVSTMSLLAVVVFVDVVQSVHFLQRPQVYWGCMAFQ